MSKKNSTPSKRAQPRGRNVEPSRPKTFSYAISDSGEIEGFGRPIEKKSSGEKSC